MAKYRSNSSSSNQKKPENGTYRERSSRFMLGLFLGFFVIGFLYVFTYVLYVQFNKEKYLVQALRQWTSDDIIPPKRGEITDRNGLMLARSGQAKTVVVEPNEIVSNIEAERVAKTLSEVLQLDYSSVYQKVSNKDLIQRTIKRQITEEQAYQIAKEYLPGVRFITESRRSYTQDGMAAQLIGFTNLDGKGQTGLEYKYQKELAGVEGRVITQSDPKGSEISVDAEHYIPATDGETLTLTLDITTQALLDDALSELYAVSGASYVQGILMDIRTGDILALTNMPNFDLNSPPREDVTTLTDISRNRVVSEEFTVNKLITPVFATLALNQNLIQEYDVFECKGDIVIDEQHIHCAENHGEQTLEQVLENGCMTSIAHIWPQLNVNDLYKTLESLGVGQNIQSGISSEKAGYLPHKRYATAGNLMMLGSGESIQMTSLQLAKVYATLANHGTVVSPHILESTQSDSGETIELIQSLPEQNALQVTGILERVVSENTSKALYLPGFPIAGLTDINYSKDAETNQTISRVTTVAIAPANQPRYVLVISVENPNMVREEFGHHIAEPYVRQVLYDRMLQNNIRPADMQGKEVDVQNTMVATPDVRGMTQVEYQEACRNVGLKYIVNTPGIASKQSPAPGTMVPMNSTILIYTASGATAMLDLPSGTFNNQVTMPDLHGKTLAQALAVTDELGLVLEAQGYPTTRISSQSVPAGDKVERGSSVQVTLPNPETAK